MKKIKYLLAIAAIALIGYNATLEVKTAQARTGLEWWYAYMWLNSEGGVDNSLQWQGWTKDEREWERPCPTETSSSGSGSGSYGGGSASGSGSHSQTNPSTRYDISCPYGGVNCTSISC